MIIYIHPDSQQSLAKTTSNEAGSVLPGDLIFTRTHPDSQQSLVKITSSEAKSICIVARRLDAHAIPPDSRQSSAKATSNGAKSILQRV